MLESSGVTMEVESILADEDIDEFEDSSGDTGFLCTE